MIQQDFQGSAPFIPANFFCHIPNSSPDEVYISVFQFS